MFIYRPWQPPRMSNAVVQDKSRGTFAPKLGQADDWIVVSHVLWYQPLFVMKYRLYPHDNCSRLSCRCVNIQWAWRQTHFNLKHFCIIKKTDAHRHCAWGPWMRVDLACWFYGGQELWPFSIERHIWWCCYVSRTEINFDTLERLFAPTFEIKEQKWPSQELFLKLQSRYLVGLGSKTLLLDSIT